MSEQVEAIITAVSDKAKTAIDAKYEELKKELATETNAKILSLEQKFNGIQNVQIVKERTSPYWLGHLAIAQAKAMQTQQTLGEVLADSPDEEMTKYLLGKIAKMAQSMGGVSNGFVEKIKGGFNRRNKSIDMTSILNGAGFSDPSAGDDYIDLLRPNSIIRQMLGVRYYTLLGGQYRLNKGLTSAISYWVGSESTGTTSSPTFGQLQLNAHKLMTLVPISNDNLRFDLHGLAQVVQQDMILSMTDEMDRAYISGTGSGNEILGLFNISGIQAIARTGSVTSTTVNKDLLKALSGLAKENVKRLNPYWLMNPENAYFIQSQVDANSNPMWYAREFMEKGTISRYPVLETTNVSTAQVGLLDSAYVAIGDGYGMMVESDASVEFKNDATVVRGISTSDILLTQAKALYAITGTTDWVIS